MWLRGSPPKMDSLTHLRIKKKNGGGKMAMERNGCGPKIEPVEPASELLLPHSHLLCIHVILKTQLRYTLKINPWLHLLVLLDPKIANSDYLVNGCRESQPNGQAIHAIIRGSKMP